MHQVGGNAVAIIGAFKDLMIRGKERSSHSKEFVETPIPKIDESMLLKLCQDSTALLRRVPTVIETEAPIYIVGDINGNLFDLIRVMAKVGSFSTTRYVFLGNYIGRGVFSVQCLALLLAMFCLCPQNIILLRGVNEFEENSGPLAFEDEIKEDYGAETTLHRQFQEVFANLPIACLVNREILCVHGGVTRNVKTIVQIARVTRPSYTLSDELLCDLLSGNPRPAKGEYIDSHMTYDEGKLRAFLEANDLRKIVRGHECVQKGVESSAGGRVFTVFSCSNYRGNGNRAGVIHITEDKEGRGIAISAVAKMPNRGNAAWVDVSPPKRDISVNPRVLRQGVGVVRRRPGQRVFSDYVSQARRSSQIIMRTPIPQRKADDDVVRTVPDPGAEVRTSDSVDKLSIP